MAILAHNAQAVAIGIEAEARVGAGGPYQGAQLAQVLRRRLRLVREGQVGFDVHLDEPAAQLPQQQRGIARAGAVDAVHGHEQVGGADRGHVHLLGDGLQVALAGLGVLPRGLELIPRRLAVLALVVDVQQFLGLGAVQEDAVGAHRLECVPGEGIVAGGDGHAAGGVRLPHGQLQGRGRADAQVHDLAPGGLQAREHAAPHHLTRGAGVAADEHATAIHVGAEGVRVVDDQVGRQALPDDPARAADCDA